MYGNFSNGEGLTDFYRFDLKKMNELSSSVKSFYLMNFFILQTIYGSYRGNEHAHWLEFSYFDIFKITKEFSLDDMNKSLRFLKKKGFIETKKSDKKGYKLIKVIWA